MTNDDSPKIDLCYCKGFVFWYLDNDLTPYLKVCRCGHLDEQHINKTGTCLGDIELR